MDIKTNLPLSRFKSGWQRLLGQPKPLAEHLFKAPCQQCLLCGVPSHASLCQLCISEVTYFKQWDIGNNLMNRHDIANALPKLSEYKLTALGPHQWPLDYLITSLKYGDKPQLFPAVAKQFVQRCLSGRGKDPLPQVILPIPMHFTKIWYRGFNQSALLAKQISELIKVPTGEHLSKRRKIAVPQSQKNAKSRRRLSMSTFKASADIAKLDHVAVFDDVVTTGSTVAAFCHALKQHNPNINIEIWCLSLSLPH